MSENELKRIVVIDGQGGGIGKSIISSLSACDEPMLIVACATNEYAMNVMKKAGAHIAVCEESGILRELRQADIVAGPIGIVIANALKGEVTPLLAQAVADCKAIKMLAPVNKCNICVVGVGEHTMSQNIAEIVNNIRAFCKR